MAEDPDRHRPEIHQEDDEVDPILAEYIGRKGVEALAQDVSVEQEDATTATAVAEVLRDAYIEQEENELAAVVATLVHEATIEQEEASNSLVKTVDSYELGESEFAEPKENLPSEVQIAIDDLEKVIEALYHCEAECKNEPSPPDPVLRRIDLLSEASTFVISRLRKDALTPSIVSLFQEEVTTTRDVFDNHDRDYLAYPRVHLQRAETSIENLSTD